MSTLPIVGVAVPSGFDVARRATEEAILTAIVAVVWLAALVHTVHVGRTERNWIGVALLLGGGLCMVQEPMVDVAGSLYLRSDITVFSTWGRDMPLWGLLAYSLYWGWFPFALSRQAQRGLTLGDYRRLIIGAFVLNLLIELPPLSLDLYEYFGRQPFQVLGLPLHWLTLNCSSAVAIAAIVAWRADLFAGPRAARAALLALVLVPAGSMGTGLPVFTALNSPGTSDVVLWASAVLTVLIGLVAIECCGRALTSASRDRPGLNDSSPDQQGPAAQFDGEGPKIAPLQM